MRYLQSLRKFNETNDDDIWRNISSEDFNEVINTCKDILLELDDNGFITSIEGHKSEHQFSGYLIIDIKKRKVEFNYSDIEDVVERLVSYLSASYGLEIEWTSGEPEVQTSHNNYDKSIICSYCKIFFMK
jgi:hypothetical protein